MAVCLLFAAVDIIYKTVQDITYLNRTNCIIYRSLPRLGFLFFEYFIELTVFVFLGIFFAAVAEKYFQRFQFIFPKNPFSAFLYASAIPVCACAAIPFVETMQEKIKFRTIITFLVAAPLLNPYVIFLSFNVLGMKYGMLRIATSFILAVSAGYLLDVCNFKRAYPIERMALCQPGACNRYENDVFMRTYNIFKAIFPYLVIAGAIAIGLELISLKKISLDVLYKKSFVGSLTAIFFGIPLYLCNGADVLLLRPLLCSGVLLGSGIAFSLTANAICITSIFMLIKFIGKGLTIILISQIFIVTLLLSQLINLFFQ